MISRASEPYIKLIGLTFLISVIIGLKDPWMADSGANIISLYPSTLIVELNDCSTDTEYNPHP